MTPVCETLDRLILFLDITIRSTDDPELVEQAEQDKSNLQLIKDTMIRKVGE